MAAMLKQLLQIRPRLSPRHGWAKVLNLGLLGMFFLLPGCVSYQDKPLGAASNAKVFLDRTFTDTRLKDFITASLRHPLETWPLPTWDCTNLVLAALYYHPDLDLARAKWLTAQAARETAGERPNPTISVTPAYNTTTAIPSPWLVTPALDIPIETAGKRRHRLAEASHASEAARLHLASTAWQVRSRVRRALVNLSAGRKMMALLETQQAIQSENVRLLEGQYQAGAISHYELTQARLAADSARLAWRDAQQQSAEARVALADAIGVPVQALDSVNVSFAGLDQLPAAIDPGESRRRALLARSDVLGALADYAAAQSALQLEIARQYPDLHLNPGYEFDQGDNKWSLGLSLTLPVFNRNRGPIAEAAAKREEAAAVFNALQARVVAEVDQSLTTYRAALLKKADTDMLLANAQKQEQNAQAMLKAGAISRSELIGLQLQLSTYAVARLEALAKAQQALGQVEEALQSSFDLPASAWQLPPRLSTSPGPDAITHSRMETGWTWRFNPCRGRDWTPRGLDPGGLADSPPWA